jgi:hypothetical protein
VEAAKEKLGSLSPVICNKLLPLVVKQLVEDHERLVSASFARIRLPKTPTADMARMYRAAFSQWTGSPYVSFVAGNEIQLGRLTPKESFVLHVFSFLGCYRTKPDDLFAVAITGETSVGKSVVFENPFSSNAHQFLNQEGVGRWNTGKHSLVMYHDINLSVLLRPSECETFKTLARTEMASVKVVGNSAYLGSLFLLLTSNQRVHTHEVENPTRELRERVKSESDEAFGKKGKTSNAQQLLLPAWRPPEQSRSGAKAAAKSGLRRTLVLESNLKPATQLDCPNVRALKSRILEAHCFQRPELEPWCIPRGEKFSRAHFLLGVYEFALSILESRERSDFYSWALPSYVLATLSLVSRFHVAHTEGGEEVRRRLLAVLAKLEPDDDEREFYLNLIQPKVKSEDSDTE